METVSAPRLHDLIAAVAAPLQIWCGRDGQIRPGGAQGVYLGDVRILSMVLLTIEGEEPEPLALSLALPDADDDATPGAPGGPAGPVPYSGQHPEAGHAGPRDQDSDHARRWHPGRGRAGSGHAGTGPDGTGYHDGPRHGVGQRVCAWYLPGGPGQNGFLASLRVRRDRVLTPESVGERIRIDSGLGVDVVARVQIRLASDLAPMATVRSGGSGSPVRPVTADSGHWGWSEPIRTERPGIAVEIAADEARVERQGKDLVLTWSVRIPAGDCASVVWSADAMDGSAALHAAVGEPEWDAVVLHTALDQASDPRPRRLLDRSLADLTGLRMASGAAPGNNFLAAGAPWFFTLFGREALWAARLMLPVSTGPALGTLRALAAHQGTANDADSGEQPGKILHEVRSGRLRLPSDTGGSLDLPPVYYGSIDATPLWICLLHDLWLQGSPAAQIEPLLPALEAALGWLRDFGDADGDGFLEYSDDSDHSSHGLANQGWKDSADAVRYRDGSLAEGPIALCEVQGYAYEAAAGGAALLEAFGCPGGQYWRGWAADLAVRFRSDFWCSDEYGRYPAMALDGRKVRVDAVASNMGHLLGTGILGPLDSDAVAERLMRPELFSGYGIRTLSAGNGGYWPLSYHCGSVWAHDTVIAVLGLAQEGHHSQARRLAAGLLDAAEAFGYRMPELFGGDPAAAGPPSPYPSACRPQAWSAASAVPVVMALAHLLD